MHTSVLLSLILRMCISRHACNFCRVGSHQLDCRTRIASLFHKTSTHRCISPAASMDPQARSGLVHHLPLSLRRALRPQPWAVVATIGADIVWRKSNSHRYRNSKSVIRMTSGMCRGHP